VAGVHDTYKKYVYYVFPDGEKLYPKTEEELLLELPEVGGSKGVPIKESLSVPLLRTFITCSPWKRVTRFIYDASFGMMKVL
jgi:hypothetical protein